MKIKEALILLAAVLFVSCGPSPESTVDTAPGEGRSIYALRCASCHQMDGSGIPKNCPPLKDSPVLAGSPEYLIKLVLLGKKGPLIRGGETYNGIMPSWRHDLNDEQVAAVLNELLERWAPSRPPITAAQVAVVRQQSNHLKTFSEADQ
jgi:mono/diheme cytochrome c family protein